MKKSKVIIPAMALLLFSTAASITGTVAWFSSTRTFTSEAGKFAVAQLEGNLTCEVTDGSATSKSGDNNITFDSTAKLGDASFNHTSKELFTDIPGATNSFTKVGDWGLLKTTNSSFYYGTIGTTVYYYAATWKYTFSYEFVAEQTNMNLYFDVNNATSEYFKADGSAHGEETLNTAQGFRLAFKSSTKAVVWAPFRAQGGTDPKDIRYVATASTYGSYSTDLLDSTAKENTTDYGLGTAADKKAATLGNCVGTLAKPGSPSTVSIDVEMTAWFEGTDPAVVTATGTLMQQVSATLPFAVRPAL